MPVMKVRWVRHGLVGVALVVVVAAVLQLGGVLPKLDPFGVETVDRSQPAVLQAIRDLSQYHAAAGDYQVIIDIEKDVRYFPAPLAGERGLFVGAGSVNAYVDFGRLAEDSIVVSPDRKSVELRLPEPVLDKPNLDQQRSYVYSWECGLLTCLNALVEIPDQQQFYVAAEQRIADVAQKSGLVGQARENTKVMLTGMLQALGFQVTIVESS
ncbi:MAG: DUF4230 domain-containing protein [Pseudonocardiales bacterium]